MDSFLESSYYDSNRFGCSSDMWIEDADRAQRCYDAAEDGCEGSTHREVIDDMRRMFGDWLRSERRERNARSEYPYRVESAAGDYFDSLETWHEQNGSLDQEIG